MEDTPSFFYASLVLKHVLQVLSADRRKGIKLIKQYKKDPLMRDKETLKYLLSDSPAMNREGLRTALIAAQTYSFAYFAAIDDIKAAIGSLSADCSIVARFVVKGSVSYLVLEKMMNTLAELYYFNGDKENCINVCRTLLSSDPNNPIAAKYMSLATARSN